MQQETMVAEGGVESTILQNQVALIAGGTGNVGSVIVGAMLGMGATVIVPSRRREKLDVLRARVAPAHSERLTTLQGDVGDERDGTRLRGEIERRFGRISAVVATLGHFVSAPKVLEAAPDDLRKVADDYLFAHFNVARTFLPAVAAGGSYTFINGPLAFQPAYPGTGLVTIVTAAQAMLARVVIGEMEDSTVRVNEVVLYTPFGWGEEGRQGAVTKDEVGRYLALLASERGVGVRGETIHLDRPEALRRLPA